MTHQALDGSVLRRGGCTEVVVTVLVIGARLIVANVTLCRQHDLISLASWTEKVMKQ